MAEEGKGVSRGDLIGLLQLVVIFTAILVGREIGDIYSVYGEVSMMSVALNLPEEEMAGYLRDVLSGKDSSLKVGLAFTLPGVEFSQGEALEIPDYVKRWLISVTLSPLLARQPEVSDIELTMLVEGEIVANQFFTFPREKVSYITYLNRVMDLVVEDKVKLRDLLQRSAEAHGGEVEISFTGKTRAHFVFLETTLPIKASSHPFVSIPRLSYVKSDWRTLDGILVNNLKKDQTVSVRLELKNPTRAHYINENVTCIIYKEGLIEPYKIIEKTVAAEAASEASYLFIFVPGEIGTYFYSLSSNRGMRVGSESSPRLLINP